MSSVEECSRYPQVYLPSVLERNRLNAFLEEFTLTCAVLPDELSVGYVCGCYHSIMKYETTYDLVTKDNSCHPTISGM